MVKYKVIFDTNSIKNEKLNNFFGGQNELKKISSYADLIIPDLVYDEILSHKRKCFFGSKQKLTGNPVFQMSELEENKIINIDNKLPELENGIEFPFQTITVNNKDYCLDFIKNKALKNESPFEEKTDKGFKDCYILYTIKEYIENFSDNEVVFIFCSGDIKLREAVSNLSKNILIVNSIKDIKPKTIQHYEDDYFLGKLKDEFEGHELTKSHITGLYFNIEYNDILEISLCDKVYLIQISEREILATELKENIENAIQKFQESPSFAETHSRLCELSNFIDYLGKDYIERIFQIILSNSQISSIINDEDIKQFLLDIKDFSKEMLDDELYGKVFNFFNGGQPIK